MPVAGSVIAIFGRPHSLISVNGSSVLIVTVEDIVYNPGSTQILADARSDAPLSPRRLQVRKKIKTSDDFNCMFFIDKLMLFIRRAVFVVPISPKPGSSSAQNVSAHGFGMLW